MGLLSSVTEHVCFQVSALNKSLTTFGTRVRLFTGVRVTMFLQRFKQSEALTTLRTYMRLFYCVY